MRNGVEGDVSLVTRERSLIDCARKCSPVPTSPHLTDPLFRVCLHWSQVTMKITRYFCRHLLISIVSDDDGRQRRRLLFVFIFCFPACLINFLCSKECTSGTFLGDIANSFWTWHSILAPQRTGWRSSDCTDAQCVCPLDLFVCA